MTESVFAAIVYVVTASFLLALVLSYALMWRLERRQHILALLIFFISTFIFVVIGNVHLWTNMMFGTAIRVPYSWARGGLMLGATVFLLATTWKRNLK